MTDDELNAAMAEMMGKGREDFVIDHYHPPKGWSPATNIAQAMEIVEYRRQQGEGFSVNVGDGPDAPNWWAIFREAPACWKGHGIADTAARAICLAALAAHNARGEE